ncbi:PREDICTED: uncharacterized protein LOC104816807 [Tarenaya hassleriana]|uniref:uncharacterized protein LOC104816807 n=1 Tax=Tarenaya hassleriana TaxID=28532 RepID=UPI00053C0E1A|nr:PREDICTED: uncharacterized protein LOC104816807 [Tarenaya hassleriana]
MEDIKLNQDEHIPIVGHDRSSIDSSRPFSSVKEAVAIFGQRIHLPGHSQTLNPKPKTLNTSTSPTLSHGASSLSSPSPRKQPFSKPKTPTTSTSPTLNHGASSLSCPSPWKQPSLPSSPSNPKEEFMDVLKKLEAELKETKTELKLLQERESETEVALATLNAELHKNMSKIAKAEADAAGKSASAMAKTTSGFEATKRRNDEREISVVKREEDRRKELMRRMENEYPTLAQILDGNKGNREAHFGKKKKKKKPIVPLVGDFLFKKKGFSGEISAPVSSTPRFS